MRLVLSLLDASKSLQNATRSLQVASRTRGCVINGNDPAALYFTGLHSNMRVGELQWYHIAPGFLQLITSSPSDRRRGGQVKIEHIRHARGVSVPPGAQLVLGVLVQVFDQVYADLPRGSADGRARLLGPPGHGVAVPCQLGLQGGALVWFVIWILSRSGD